MAERLGDAVLELRTDDRKYRTGLRGAESAAKRHVKNVAKIAAVASIAIAGVSIKMAADMERGLREIGTLMGDLTDKQLRAMGQELEVIASRTGQAMGMLTGARYDIVSAGFASAAESAELLRVSADLAVAGVTDIVKAGDLLTTTMNAYGFSADKAEEISDKLFTTVRLGKTTIEGMAGSLGRVLGVAGTLGLDINELLAGFATLTTTMGSSERATTALLGSIQASLTPTKELEGIVKELGFTSSFAMIESEGFAETIEKVKEKAEELNIPLTDVFSSMEGLQGILPLTGTAAEKFSENIEGVENSLGATANAAGKMQKDFTLQMNRLKQNVGNIMRAIGRSLIEIIRPMVEEANAIFERLGDIGWDVVGSTILMNWRIILQAVGDITWIAAKDIGGMLVKGIGQGFTAAVGGLFNIIGDAIKFAFVDAPKAALTGLKPSTREARTSFEGISDVIAQLIDELVRLAEEGKPQIEAVEQAAKDMQAALDAAGESGKKAGENITDTVQIASQLGSAIGGALGEAATGGDAFKGFIIKVLNLLEGVIVGASAVNAAITAAWVPVLGIAGLIAAVAVLEAAKAGVRGISFAQGGIINAPALITAGNAVAQVAEAGRPEGVLPLTRMPGGDLGVKASGALGNITLSVTVQSSVIANRQTVRELLEPPLVDLAEKLQSKLRVRQ